MTLHYRYFNNDGQPYDTDIHFLTARELCKKYSLFNPNGSLPYKKLSKILDTLQVQSFYYRPNPKSDFNKIKVYNPWYFESCPEVLSVLKCIFTAGVKVNGQTK